MIKKNGNMINLVPDLYEAWHAGISNWKNYKSLNKNSIGIEIPILVICIVIEIFHQNKFFHLKNC